MVDAIRANGAGGARPLAREGIRTAEGGFALETEGGPAVQGARVSTTPSIGLDSMLMLQSINEARYRDRAGNEARERDRAGKRRGAAMIAALSDLQRAMLAEEDPALALRSLSELATDDGPLADDPELAGILRAVVLRSRVEVARRERGV